MRFLRFFVCIVFLVSSVLPHSARAQPSENIVLLPLLVPPSLQGKRDIYAAAIQNALRDKFNVFYGPQVEEALRREMAKTDCSAESCVQNIAVEFNGEIVVDAVIDELGSSYVLSIKFNNVITGELEESILSTCDNCSENALFKFVQQQAMSADLNPESGLTALFDKTEQGRKPSEEQGKLNDLARTFEKSENPEPQPEPKKEEIIIVPQQSAKRQAPSADFAREKEGLSWWVYGLPLLALGGGGGGGGGGGDVSGGGSAGFVPSPGPNLNQVEGDVVKGPLHGATVFLDYNDNGALDTGEPFTQTDNNGSYSFQVENANAALVVITDENTVDTSTGEVMAGLLLKAPQGSTVITPVTTLFADGDMTEAEAKTALGLPASLNLKTFNPFDEGVDPDVALQLEKAALKVVNTVNSLTAATSGMSNSAQKRGVFSSIASALKEKADANEIFDFSSDDDLRLMVQKAEEELSDYADVTSDLRDKIEGALQTSKQNAFNVDQLASISGDDNRLLVRNIGDLRSELEQDAQTDSDGDGIADILDAFPNDPGRSERAEPFTSWERVKPYGKYRLAGIGLSGTYRAPLPDLIVNNIDYSGDVTDGELFVRYQANGAPAEFKIKLASDGQTDSISNKFSVNDGDFISNLGLLIDGEDEIVIALSGQNTDFALAAEPTAPRLNWKFQSFGALETGRFTGAGEVAALSAGYLAPGANIANVGSAQFSGITGGSFINAAGTRDYLVTSEILFGINFSNKTFDFQTENARSVDLVSEGWEWNSSPSLNFGGQFIFNGTANWTGLLTTSGGMSGELTGNYYGPVGQEVGGVFYASGDGVSTYVGGFGAKLDGDFDGDADGDGVSDGFDAFPLDPNESLDTDGDGVGDNADAFPSNSLETLDTDGDGFGDNSDAFVTDASEWYDSDGDGVGNNQDAFDFNPNETADLDGDGIGDNADSDRDGDGVVNWNDAFPSDASETADLDSDGIGDNADTDRDGDGLVNGDDAYPDYNAELADNDGDLVADNADAFDNNIYEWVDSDGDGVGDNRDLFPSNLGEAIDRDGDGIGDNSDDDYDYIYAAYLRHNNGSYEELDENDISHGGEFPYVTANGPEVWLEPIPDVGQQKVVSLHKLNPNDIFDLNDRYFNAYGGENVRLYFDNGDSYVGDTILLEGWLRDRDGNLLNNASQSYVGQPKMERLTFGALRYDRSDFHSADGRVSIAYFNGEAAPASAFTGSRGNTVFKGISVGHIYDGDEGHTQSDVSVSIDFSDGSFDLNSDNTRVDRSVGGEITNNLSAYDFSLSGIIANQRLVSSVFTAQGLHLNSFDGGLFSSSGDQLGGSWYITSNGSSYHYAAAFGAYNDTMMPRLSQMTSERDDDNLYAVNSVFYNGPIEDMYSRYSGETTIKLGAGQYSLEDGEFFDQFDPDEGDTVDFNWANAPNLKRFFSDRIYEDPEVAIGNIINEEDEIMTNLSYLTFGVARYKGPLNNTEVQKSLAFAFGTETEVSARRSANFSGSSVGVFMGDYLGNGQDFYYTKSRMRLNVNFLDNDFRLSSNQTHRSNCIDGCGFSIFNMLDFVASGSIDDNGTFNVTHLSRVPSNGYATDQKPANSDFTINWFGDDGDVIGGTWHMKSMNKAHSVISNDNRARDNAIYEYIGSFGVFKD